MKSAFERWASFLQSQTFEAPKPVIVPAAAITLSREAGCGAVHVANELATILSHTTKSTWSVFDRNLIDLVLSEHQVPAHLASFIPEDKIGLVEDLLADVFQARPTSQELLHHTAETILKLVAIGNVIVIGRGSHVITAKYPRVLHVRLVADLLDRAIRTSVDDKTSVDVAKAKCLKEDKAKARYLNSYYRQDITDPTLYHAILNTSKLTYRSTATVIASALTEFLSQAPPR